MTPYMRKVTNHLQSAMSRLDISWSSLYELNLLRRQAISLRKCFELECSDERRYAWASKRAEKIEQTIAKRCRWLGLQYYIQGDCRGACLYVSKTPIDSASYDRAVCLDAV